MSECLPSEVHMLTKGDMFVKTENDLCEMDDSQEKCMLADTNNCDVLQEAMILMGLLPQNNTVSFDDKKEIKTEKLKDLTFEQFMDGGLTVRLLNEIILEYGQRAVKQFQGKSLTDLTSVQFLHRYDTVGTHSLSHQLNGASTDVYSDENYSLTNFSSKLMHDLNAIHKGELCSRTIKDYMKDVGTYLKQNIFLCKDIGSQNDKHNLPGLYYRLLMVHLMNMNKVQRKTKREGNEEKRIWKPLSSLIFHDDNLYDNMTLLMLYAFMHVENDLCDITLVLYSQYILRVIQSTELTVAGHNAAHVAVMCQDIPGMIALFNRPDIWNCTDNEGLLPIEHALLGMLHTQNETSIITFIVSWIKSDLQDKVVNPEKISNKSDQLRLTFIHHILKFVLQLDNDRLLDLKSSVFAGIYSDTWKETDIISQIPSSVNFGWSQKKHFFSTLNHIYAVMHCCTKSNLLKLIVDNCLTETQKQKVQLLTDDFMPMASVPMVLEEIKAKVCFTSYFGCPRKLIAKNLPCSGNLHDEDTAIPLTIDRREYSALCLNWCPVVQHVAAKHDFSLKSARTLNDSDSIYAYCFLLGMFQFCTDITSAINLMKDKVRTIGGNGKPFRFLKRKRTDSVLTNDYLVGYQNVSKQRKM